MRPKRGPKFARPGKAFILHGIKYVLTGILVIEASSKCISRFSSCEDFQLLRNQLETQHKKLPSVHILGDFNFRDIVWPDKLSKNGTMLSQSEGQVLVNIMNDGLEELVNFPTREENTLDLILTSLFGQFQRYTLLIN